MTRRLRWLLVIPGAWAAWSLALVTGIAVHSGLERLCPREQMISGVCTAAWFGYAERVVICSGAGLAATLILVTCACIAPSHRPQVVAMTFVVGSLAALIMGALAHAYAELFTALAVGSLVAVWLLKSPWVRSPPQPRPERASLPEAP